MKVLVLSDIHGKINKLKQVLDAAGDVDLVAVLGDVTDFGPSQTAEKALDLILREKGDAVGVPGNCDPKEIDEVLERKINSVDQDKEVLDGWFFVGLGGSNPTPFNTPRELKEDKIYNVLDNLFSDIEGETVLISHSPPKKTVDLTSGTHAGSESVRKIVEKYEPEVVLSGHIHEARGSSHVKDTLVVNPGAVRDGKAAKIDLDTLEVEFFSA